VFLSQYHDPMQLVLLAAGIGGIGPLKQPGAGILLIPLTLSLGRWPPAGGQGGGRSLGVPHPSPRASSPRQRSRQHVDDLQALTSRLCFAMASPA